MSCIQEEDIIFRESFGWVIYAQCDVPCVEEDEVTAHLTVTLINITPQGNDVKAQQPKEGSNENKVWDPDVKK